MDQIRDGGRQRTEAELANLGNSTKNYQSALEILVGAFFSVGCARLTASCSSFSPHQIPPVNGTYTRVHHSNHYSQRLLLTLGDLLDLTHQHLLVTKLLRSAWHPSTRHDTVCVPLLRARALLDDPEVDEDVILETPTASLDLVNTDSVPEFPTWPSFKSTENSPLVLYIPYLLEPSIVSMLGKFA
ncbi:hypothetical protein GmHk_05G014289 [Glycine max]|nr:hypothetical protein GmHk_05G014289 [Glycine max]